MTDDLLEGRRTISAITPYPPPEGSARVRIEGWRRHTSAAIRIHPYTTRPAIRRWNRLVELPVTELRRRSALRRPHDVLFITREASPLPLGTWDRAALGRARHGVYDLDDAVFLRQAFGSGHARRAESLARSADVVVAGNPYLADWAGRFTTDVRIIPSCVEPDEYSLKANYDTHDPPLVGWLGSHSTERYLQSLARPLLELHGRTGARLLMLSASGGDLGELAGITTRRTWSVTAQADFAHQVDLGIMPLPDTDWARGKCGYKLLQYAVAGLPAVASPVGENVPIARRTGAALAGTDDEWLETLTSILTTSSTARARRGDDAHNAAVEHFSYAAWAGAWNAAVLG